MNFNCHKADLIAKIQSSSKGRLISIRIIKTKRILLIIKKLYDIGLLNGFIIEDHYVKLLLKYKRSNCMIKRISIVSTPGRKVYWSVDKIKRMKDRSENLIYFISTTQGIKFDWECILHGKIGGEVILKLEI